METLQGVLAAIRATDIHLFTLKNAEISLWDVITVVIAVVALFSFARWIKTWVATRLLARTQLDHGTRYAIGTVTRYVVLIGGLMIIMQTVGINLTTFNVLAGALGVGIGFGLQDIFKNFISGMIIMFDRPIHIGDRIEIAGVAGEVVDIGARRVTLMTPDGLTVVVPNSKFVTDPVKNHHSAFTPGVQRIAFNVSRDSDVRLAQRLVSELLADHPRVQKDPAPFVRLGMPTPGAFPLEVRFHTTQNERERDEVLNDLHYALHEKLQGAGIKLA